MVSISAISHIFPSQSKATFEPLSRLCKKSTTKQTDKWKSYSENLIIPSDRLVYLMVAADKKDEAINLIESMLFCIENDVRNLNLKNLIGIGMLH